MGPDEPKFTPVADTAQFARTVAVQTVLPAYVVLLPVGQVAAPR
jgi:hypothetical protein